MCGSGAERIHKRRVRRRESREITRAFGHSRGKPTASNSRAPRQMAAARTYLPFFLCVSKRMGWLVTKAGEVKAADPGG
eukprot:9328291-Pyramimonas_sp.AAC.1